MIYCCCRTAIAIFADGCTSIAHTNLFAILSSRFDDDDDDVDAHKTMIIFRLHSASIMSRNGLQAKCFVVAVDADGNMMMMVGDRITREGK